MSEEECWYMETEIEECYGWCFCFKSPIYPEACPPEKCKEYIPEGDVGK